MTNHRTGGYLSRIVSYDQKCCIYIDTELCVHCKNPCFYREKLNIVLCGLGRKWNRTVKMNPCPGLFVYTIKAN